MSLSGNTEKINSLIAAINALPEAGSGGGGGATSLALLDSGSFTMGSYSYSLDQYKIEHNAGKVPLLVVVTGGGPGVSKGLATPYVAWNMGDVAYYVCKYYSGTGTTQSTSTNVEDGVEFDWTDTYIYLPNDRSLVYTQNKTFSWKVYG